MGGLILSPWVGGLVRPELRRALQGGIGAELIQASEQFSVMFAAATAAADRGHDLDNSSQ